MKGEVIVVLAVSSPNCLPTVVFAIFVTIHCDFIQFTFKTRLLGVAMRGVLSGELVEFGLSEGGLVGFTGDVHLPFVISCSYFLEDAAYFYHRKSLIRSPLELLGLLTLREEAFATDIGHGIVQSISGGHTNKITISIISLALVGLSQVFHKHVSDGLQGHWLLFHGPYKVTLDLAGLENCPVVGEFQFAQTCLTTKFLTDFIHLI